MSARVFMLLMGLLLFPAVAAAEVPADVWAQAIDQQVLLVNPDGKVIRGTVLRVADGRVYIETLRGAKVDVPTTEVASLQTLNGDPFPPDAWGDPPDANDETVLETINETLSMEVEGGKLPEDLDQVFGDVELGVKLSDRGSDLAPDEPAAPLEPPSTRPGPRADQGYQHGAEAAEQVVMRGPLLLGGLAGFGGTCAGCVVGSVGGPCLMGIAGTGGGVLATGAVAAIYMVDEDGPESVPSAEQAYVDAYVAGYEDALRKRRVRHVTLGGGAGYVTALAGVTAGTVLLGVVVLGTINN